jgi:hypothetical protein
MPVLDVEMAPIPTKLRTDEPFQVTVTVENRSRHAAASGLEFRLCPWDFDMWCEPAWYASFGYLELPVIAPASAFTTTYTTVIPPSAVEQRLPTIVTVGACLVEQSWTDPYLVDRYDKGWPSQACPSGYNAEVRPDILTGCNPPVLTIGETATLSEPNCGIRPLTSQPISPFYSTEQTNQDIIRERFHVFSFMAAPGRVYRFAEKHGNIFEPDFNRSAVTRLPDDAFSVTRPGLYIVNAERTITATLLDLTP